MFTFLINQICIDAVKLKNMTIGQQRGEGWKYIFGTM